MDSFSKTQKGNTEWFTKALWCFRYCLLFLGMVVELIRSLLQRWKVCPVLGCPGETDKYKNGTRGCLGFLKW